MRAYRIGRVALLALVVYRALPAEYVSVDMEEGGLEDAFDALVEIGEKRGGVEAVEIVATSDYRGE